MKPIRLSKHALSYLEKRGFTRHEVEETIRTLPWKTAELNKMECKKDFPYNTLWNGKYYTTKQVRPIFVVEETEIVVVTVYTYYF